MARIGSIGSNLPVPVEGSSRFAGRREPRSAFVGQLMGRRQRPAGTLLAALRTYDEGGRLKRLRLPPGYTLDLEV